MNYYIGLDIGTSSVKAMLISDDKIIKIVSKDYPIYFPKPGYSEQNPSDWYLKSITAIKELTADIDKSKIQNFCIIGIVFHIALLVAPTNSLPFSFPT